MEIAAEVDAEVTVEITMEIFVVRFDWGVRNLIYYYIVVQAGSGFDVDTSAALYLTVAVEAAAEVIMEITTEILVEVVVEIFVVRLD